MTAGILESGRPLRFVHPIVRSGIYSELTTAERAQGHDTAARLLADRPGQPSPSPSTYSPATQPATAGSSSGSSEPRARPSGTAHRNRPSRSCAAHSTNRRRQLTSQVSCSSSERPRRTRASTVGTGTCRTPSTRHPAPRRPPKPRSCSRARSTALSDLPRRSRSSIAQRRRSTRRESELALTLEAAAVVIGMSDPRPRPRWPPEVARLRERAAVDPAASPELLAVASFVSILTNEPADVGASLATRALSADGAPLFSSALFARATLSLLWAERYAERAARCSTARLRRPAWRAMPPGSPRVLRTEPGLRFGAAT